MIRCFEDFRKKKRRKKGGQTEMVRTCQRGVNEADDWVEQSRSRGTAAVELRPLSTPLGKSQQ